MQPHCKVYENQTDQTSLAKTYDLSPVRSIAAKAKLPPLSIGIQEDSETHHDVPNTLHIPPVSQHSYNLENIHLARKRSAMITTTDMTFTLELTEISSRHKPSSTRKVNKIALKANRD